MSRGAPRVPITYEGEYDATRTYLPRQIVTVTAGPTRTGYLSTATTTGDDPATSPTIWLPLGGGGDSEHNGTGTDSTAVGTGATAAGSSGTSVGDGAIASADYSTAIGQLATVYGSGGVAIGWNAQATDNNSIAIGQGSNASGNNGVVVGGSGATASGINSTALGTSATAAADRAFAIGAAASCSTADRGVLQANDVQIDRSSGSGVSRLILHDANSIRWAISVSITGVVSAALA